VPDGTQALSGHESEIVVWDTRTCEETAAFTGHQAKVTCLAVASETATVLLGDAAGEVILWSLNGLNACAVLPGTSGMRRLAVTADSRGAVVGSDDGSVMLWDLESRTHPGSFIPDDRLTACTIDPAGERAILGDDLGLVHILAVSLPWIPSRMQQRGSLRAPAA
jgi:WD40 repeat protein